MWPTRIEAPKHVEGRTAWNLALARRSVILFSLGPGVETWKLPKQWPTITWEERKYAFGVCVIFHRGRARN
jgi:hypothetical protein